MSNLALAYILYSPHTISLCFYLALVQICWPNHVTSIDIPCEFGISCEKKYSPSKYIDPKFLAFTFIRKLFFEVDFFIKKDNVLKL